MPVVDLGRERHVRVVQLTVDEQLTGRVTAISTTGHCGEIFTAERAENAEHAENAEFVLGGSPDHLCALGGLCGEYFPCPATH